MAQRTHPPTQRGFADVDAAAARAYVGAVGLPLTLLPVVLVLLLVVGAIEGWAIALAVAGGAAVGIGLVVVLFRIIRSTSAR
ncbi:hypothetical protein GCM10022215_07500 [Nocardioides fonticola]|uniref:Uncharacterized protein n=1 Tax=Nocardioides fonticola TaxID=450363 RepID=A0ABP7XCK2_9ACTN